MSSKPSFNVEQLLIFAEKKDVDLRTHSVTQSIKESWQHLRSTKTLLLLFQFTWQISRLIYLKTLFLLGLGTKEDIEEEILFPEIDSVIEGRKFSLLSQNLAKRDHADIFKREIPELPFTEKVVYPHVYQPIDLRRACILLLRRRRPTYSLIFPSALSVPAITDHMRKIIASLQGQLSFNHFIPHPPHNYHVAGSFAALLHLVAQGEASVRQDTQGEMDQLWVSVKQKNNG